MSTWWKGFSDTEVDSCVHPHVRRQQTHQHKQLSTPFHFTSFRSWKEKVWLCRKQPFIKFCSDTIKKYNPHSLRNLPTADRLLGFICELRQSKCSVQSNLATRVYVHEHKCVWKWESNPIRSFISANETNKTPQPIRYECPAAAAFGERAPSA